MTQALLLQKLKATAWHFLITLLVAGACGLLIFGIWYPDDLAAYVGGVELYQLVLMVELAVGPLMSLIIYNPGKARSELVRDYCVVGVIQLGALAYGLWSVAQARPAYLVFVKDRFEVVSAITLDEKDLKQASEIEYSRIPWSGPKRICVSFPTSVEESNSLMFSAAYGKDIQLYPKYYRACRQGEVSEKAFAAEKLQAIIDSKKGSKIDMAGQDAVLPEGEYTWLPVNHRLGTWVEVYPNSDPARGYFINVDPFR